MNETSRDVGPSPQDKDPQGMIIQEGGIIPTLFGVMTFLLLELIKTPIQQNQKMELN